ncbi:MAG: hypothetical protein JO210_16260 [Acidobacteriaceae bacterium]|nr:hypothetical protein [Acidobacteriaceae bacterium]
MGKREVMQALRRELRHVPPLLRRPIEMHYISELPVKDVASALGLSEAATKSRLHRGHLYLRDRMLKHAARRGPASLIARWPKTAKVETYYSTAAGDGRRHQQLMSKDGALSSSYLLLSSENPSDFEEPFAVAIASYTASH